MPRIIPANPARDRVLILILSQFLTRTDVRGCLPAVRPMFEQRSLDDLGVPLAGVTFCVLDI